ncbi:ABC transporter ATP-binding protein [Anaerosphaera multitolerans]|uniref:ABC transporter ATP-binding protein n=1 Tax=Anaerosphaera multitolerans TaxID=2487351 RepID=A0A437S7Y6_9FIRM|nr:ABC transporter ATP-binding protein [Anaerosphaera multitolerans]RVU55199.1 ABC transporter ATP-binding protein [Anaerosphaera multitolerans]
MEKLIEIKELNKSFGNVKALDNLNFNLYSGDIYGLVGENGAGKSTLLKVIAGHINKTSGSCTVLNMDLDKSFEFRKECGFLIESPAFYSYMTGIKNLNYLAELRNIKIDNEILEIAEFFNIDSVLNKKVKGYSTGMRQRLGILAAVMHKPRILILDEPINGLDPSGIIDLRNFLLKINKEWNTTIIVSSHILNELSQIANRIGIIKNGSMLEEITLEDLKERNKKFLKLVPFEKEELPKVVNILEEKLKIYDFKVMPNSVIEIYSGADRLIIQKTLAKNDIYLSSISIEENTLEEYYMDLVGGGENDIFKS